MGRSIGSTGCIIRMGTTRIDRDARFGVVDAECRVHGLENLFIAGSSVFPNGHGYANPTLTVLALAIRLGDHLSTVLGVRGADSNPTTRTVAALPERMNAVLVHREANCDRRT